MRTIAFYAAVIGLCAISTGVVRASSETETPWWEQEKIRFFWGWVHPFYEAGVTNDKLMDSLSKAGVNVLVLPWDWDAPDPLAAQLPAAAAVKKHGMRCFGRMEVAQLPYVSQPMNAPLAVDAQGNSDPKLPDPFFKPAYEEWFLKQALRLARSGLVDGLLIGWEFYGGRGEGREVYNDKYFNAFLKRKGISKNVTVKQRHRWLVGKNLHNAYLGYLRDLTAAMFRDLAAEVRKVKPDFIFASNDNFYGNLDNGGWRSAGIAAGLHSPEAPYFVIDSRHYWDYGAVPWWDDVYSYLHKLGYKHIAGSYGWRMFGGRPDTQISAVQWMYESAMHSDGFWLYTEREFGTYEWQAFAAADRRIKGVEQKVGKFLIQGEQDNHFATLVEWSGNPEMDRKVKQHVYHVGEEHLIMVNNVDSFRPLQVRVRLPALAAGSLWTVRDPMTDVYFSHDGKSAVWDAKQLLEGLVLPMEKRSDQFLLLSPADSEVSVPQTALVRTQADMPLRESFDESPNGEDISGNAGGKDRLLFLKTESLDNLGLHGPWVIGSGIFSANLTAGKATRLRHGKGNLWSPSWSPDRKKILFAHYAHGRGQIYTMNANGSGVVNLSRNDYCDKQPAWSADGRKIAFASDRDGDWEIYVMNADGSGQRRLTNSPGADTSPAWSPKGDLIAFESDRQEDTDIYVMRTDGSDQKPIIKRACDVLEPIWSPDGRRLAATCPDWPVRALVIADVETGRLTIPWQGYHTWQVESPCWSPDGNRIATAYAGVNGRTSGIALFDLTPKPVKGAKPSLPVGVMGTMDTPLEEISHEIVFGVNSHMPRPGGWTFTKPGRPSWYAYGSAAPAWIDKQFYGLSWSPDGKKLAFSSDMDETGAFFVYVMPMGTKTAGKPVKVADSSSAWPQQVMWGTK